MFDENYGVWQIYSVITSGLIDTNNILVAKSKKPFTVPVINILFFCLNYGSKQRFSCFQGKVYVFDKVLKPNVTQTQVYEAAAKSIVKGKLTLFFSVGDKRKA